MATTTNNRRKWLRRAGLIVGLVGAGGLTLFILATTETLFTWYAVPTVLVLGLPFLAMVAVAWKWPLIGGILLIATGLFWTVWRAVTIPPTPYPFLLPLLVWGILPVSLPLLASGILFLLSWEGRR